MKTGRVWGKLPNKVSGLCQKPLNIEQLVSRAEFLSIADRRSHCGASCGSRAGLSLLFRRMLAKLFRVLIALAVSSAAFGDTDAEAKPIEIYPVSKVKRGQKGYGMTTMKGTIPERFEFEVIGVNRNFLPKMDIILVKSDDPKIQISGFWRGMSGSPLYIEGKLTCAFSYGFRFNKLAIGGCTPLGYMQEEGFQERRGASNVHARGSVGKSQVGVNSSAAPRNAASLAEWLEVVPKGDISELMKRGNRRSPWLLASGLPKRAPLLRDEEGMQPSAVPLALSGFSAPAFADVKQVMAGFPLEPMQAGGTGSPNEGPTEFRMGGAIAVQLVRGDMSAAATGTVSLVEGDDVLAFGHPMFHAGEIYAPVAAAHIHTVIPSAQNAFILASPLRELGSLTQDRQSTIAADTSLKINMIPMHIRVKSNKGKSIGDFNVEILDNRFFTATFASVAATNATALYMPDREHVTVRMHSKVQIKGHKPLEFTDFLYSSRGAGGIVNGARGLRVLSPLLSNPFGTLEVEAIDLEVEIDYSANFVDVTGLTLPKAELVPGKRNYVNVHVTPFHGEEMIERVAFDVPKELAGSIVRLEVTSGDSAPMYIAPPTTATELVEAFRTLLPGTVYAITIYSASEGAAVNGKLIKDLPPTALNRLRSATRSPSLSTRRAQARSVFPTKHVVEGSFSVLAKVANKK